MKSMNGNRQAGAVSLFVVIFATLLITVVTIGFLQLMIKDQLQASNADLSQSAYDSAQAGIEDAKRALLEYQELCATDVGACNNLAIDLNSTQCNTGLYKAGIISNDTGEVRVQQSSNSANDQLLNQAYTCVTMSLDTPDYLATLSPGQSRFIPLKGTTGYNTVTIEWFNQEDVGVTTNLLTGQSSRTVDIEDAGTKGMTFYQSANWPSTRPSVMRAQFMQFGDSFTLDSFNDTGDAAGTTLSNAGTVFLYPSTVGSNNSILAGLDGRLNAKDSSTTPTKVQCKTDLSGGDYSCSMTLELPVPSDNSTSARTAYLRLTPYYNATHIRVKLQNGNVNFRAVQPQIDATGRANDLYRRVQSRVELLDANFPYPDASIDITGNLCKDLKLTKNTADYAGFNPTSGSGVCLP